MYVWGRRGRGGRGLGAPEVLSEACPGGAGVGEVGCDDSVTLGAADHVADLAVELQQLGADQAEVLPGTHQGDGARLAQGLVAEVDVEQRLYLRLRAAPKHPAGPLPPDDEIKQVRGLHTNNACFQCVHAFTYFKSDDGEREKNTSIKLIAFRKSILEVNLSSIFLCTKLEQI